MESHNTLLSVCCTSDSLAFVFLYNFVKIIGACLRENTISEYNMNYAIPMTILLRSKL